jgi:hypothetical protein
MHSLAENLPAEIANRIHPDWRKNERDYWTVRDSLMGQYCNRWIAFADGKVIASGESPVQVMHAGQLSAPHAFLICVGREDEPTRMRRVAFPYDSSYRGEAHFRGPAREVVVNP